MRADYILYENPAQFAQAAVDARLSADTPYVILIHTSIHRSAEAVEVARQVQRLFPRAAVAGTSANTILHHAEIYDQACIVMFFSCREAEMKLAITPYADLSPEDLAAKVVQENCGEHTKALLALFGGQYAKCHFFVTEFNRRRGDIVLHGALVGSTFALNEDAYMFTPQGLCPPALLTVAFSGKNLHCFSRALIGHEAVGDVYTLTKVTGEQLDEVDFRPAAEWVREMLGMETIAECSDWGEENASATLVRFPIVLEGHHGASRFIRYHSEGDRILLYGNELNGNPRFRLGYMSPLTVARDCRQLCEDLQRDVPAEMMLCYSCLFRKYYMNSCSSWEIRPFKRTRISGVYMFGEIGRIGGCNEYLNGSSVFLAMSENPAARADLDMGELDNFDQLEDSTRDIYTYVLKKQNETMLNKSERLMSLVANQEKSVSRGLFIDPVTSTYNYSKFVYDYRKLKFDKMCMIKVAQGSAMIGHFGLEKFGRLMRGNIDAIKRQLPDKRLRVYRYNQAVFMVAASQDYPDDAFVEDMQALYQDCGIYRDTGFDVSCINNFAIALGEAQLLENVEATASAAAAAGRRFMIYDETLNPKADLQVKFDIVSVIHDAITNNGVVPYYQPIIDNRRQCVSKLEALMRLRGADGRVYMPGEFLGIAHEYKLYTQLSLLMLQQVFADFSGRNVEVSLNVSAVDIDSEAVRAKIYELLGQTPTPGNFVVEILESEGFRDFSRLTEFVGKIKGYGAKIAIDDFGSGYSNLLEIARLSPDYIKIDGEIIRNLPVDPVKQKIVDTVVFLAERLQTQVIAERVESAEIQRLITEKGIAFTQGYFFAKPMPHAAAEEFLRQTPAKPS